jgi:hypothetical protein
MQTGNEITGYNRKVTLLYAVSASHIHVTEMYAAVIDKLLPAPEH